MEPVIGIEFVACGWDFRHPSGFTIDRPSGRSDWGAMIFTTSGRCRTAAGEALVPAGTCLVFAPGQAQHYGSDRGPFANHWCHWQGPAAADLARSLALTCQHPVRLADPGAAARAIRALERESLRREPGWEAACAAGVVALLVVLARGMRLRGRADDRPLHDLRAEVLARPHEPWPVARMARRVGLSASRFAARYHAAFGSSPVADLIAARIDRARLLIESGSTVAEAAETSGFADLPYFHRQFRRLVGCTPAACRSGHRSGRVPAPVNRP